MNLAPSKAARRPARELAMLALSGLALYACSDNRALPSYARLNRSNAVDFACTKLGMLVPLSNCRVSTPAEAVNFTAYAFVTQSARGEIATIDLRNRTVLDTRRDIPGYTYVPAGEGPIAIVVPPTDPRRTYVANFGSHDVYVFDTRALIPPSQGSGPIQVVPLSVTLQNVPTPAAPTQMILSPDESALLITVPELGRVMRLPITRCDAATPDCEEGGRIDETAIGSAVLQASVDKVAAATAAIAAGPSARTPAQIAARYEELCGFAREAPPPALPVVIDAQALTAAPHPRGLAFDTFCPPQQSPCPARLLVADDALPLIHVIDPALIGVEDGSAAILNPIPVGVPTREVAVTPAVPITLDSPAGEDTHYVYAIDAGDGSLMVIEDGQVLNVNSDPSAPANRIALPNGDGGGPAAAATLAVLTPDYDATGSRYLLRAPNQMLPTDASAAPGDGRPIADAYCPQPSAENQDPLLLRGVFVAVALSDGTVRLIDVHDMTLRAPQGDACRKCPTGSPPQTIPPQIPLLVRHHLRLSRNLEGSAMPSLTPVVNPLAFAVAGRQFPIRQDGTSGSPDTPGLECLSCAGLKPLFPAAVIAPPSATATETAAAVAADKDRCPAEAPARLCGSDDPWSASTEAWSATYEGIIPGASGGGAVFVAPGAANDQAVAPEVAAGIDFCAAGVLGDEDVAAAYDPLACDAGQVPAGDQIVITSRLIDSAGRDCELAREALESDSDLAIAFPIRRAYRDHVIISSQASYPPAAPSALLAIRSYEDVRRCLGGAPMSFSVRLQQAFLVRGDDSGFQHRVIANSAQRCSIDGAADRLHEGRAWPGCTFQNGAIAFRIRRPGPGESAPAVGVQLQVKLNSPVPSAVFDAANIGLSRTSVLPVQMRYLEFSRYLYLVDIYERGLVPIPAGDGPFPVSVDATLTFN